MHLLASEISNLDEVETAIDLEQTPADVVVLSFADSDLWAVASAWEANADTLSSLRLANLKQLKHPMSVDMYLERVIDHAKVVIVRCLGGMDYWRYGIEAISAVAKRHGILFAAIPGCDKQDPRLAEFSTAPAEMLAMLDRYFREGGVENISNALRYVDNVRGLDVEWAEPKPVGSIVAFRADGTTANLTDIAAEQDARPSALITFYRANLMAADTAPISSLMTALEQQGIAPIALAVTSLKDAAIAEPLAALIKARQPSVILNATAFSARRDDATTVLDDAGVPVMQVVLAGGARETWEKSGRGLSATDLAMNVVAAGTGRATAFAHRIVQIFR